MASPWLIHTSMSTGQSAKRARTPVGQLGAAVLALAGPRHGAAELQRHELGAVTEPEDRDPELVDGRVDVGAGVS
jgi:citrate synthase